MAKKAKKVKETPLSARERREIAREEAAKARRSQNMLIGGFGLALLAILAGFLYLNFRGRGPVVGEEVFVSQGNSHIAYGTASPVEYNSFPPSSGPHYDPLLPWEHITEPWRYEHYIHNLEDGGVVIYYQCEEEECAELEEQLNEVAGLYWQNAPPRNHVVVARNDPSAVVNDETIHRDLGAKIALVAWGRVLKLDEFDRDTVSEFIAKYVGIDHHVRSSG